MLRFCQEVSKWILICRLAEIQNAYTHSNSFGEVCKKGVQGIKKNDSTVLLIFVMVEINTDILKD